MELNEYVDIALEKTQTDIFNVTTRKGDICVMCNETVRRYSTSFALGTFTKLVRVEFKSWCM